MGDFGIASIFQLVLSRNSSIGHPIIEQRLEIPFISDEEREKGWARNCFKMN